MNKNKVLVFLAIFSASAILAVTVHYTETVGADTGLDPMKGAADGTVAIVEYSDFQCPACKTMDPVVDEMVKKYPRDIRVIYKNFPLTRIHKWAYTAALAGECALDQGKFWQFHDILFDEQRIWSGASDARERFVRYAVKLGIDQDRFNECIGSESIRQRVDDDIKEGKRLNIHSTPTFFINGKRYVGVWKVEEFDRIVKKEIGNR